MASRTKVTKTVTKDGVKTATFLVKPTLRKVKLDDFGEPKQADLDDIIAGIDKLKALFDGYRGTLIRCNDHLEVAREALICGRTYDCVDVPLCQDNFVAAVSLYKNLARQMNKSLEGKR